MPNPNIRQVSAGTGDGHLSEGRGTAGRERDRAQFLDVSSDVQKKQEAAEATSCGHFTGIGPIVNFASQMAVVSYDHIAI
jgi:hypothetical protein